eukprot:TRINITY_DN5742_c0_g1_i3.p1 TRINITY_DN5742_c0_g1~~TRINITY_DN5742_c0_g1_i3.p1  ORF type:complete len:717 (+),score=134.04 TRINITY_DN5742_c0_g1_i3:60-2153(+)
MDTIELRDQVEVQNHGQYIDEDRNYLNDQLHLEYFDLHVEGIQLLTDAKLKLTPGHRYGLIGNNGVGKTTLMRHLAAKKFHGMWKNHQVTLMVGAGKSAFHEDRKVIEEVLCGFETLEDVKVQTNTNPDDEVSKCFSKKLEIYTMEEIKAQAYQILHGLSFASKSPDTTTVAQLSGGWKYRLDIAKTLLLEPDLLLMDEPTNHLDIETSIWLQDYLSTYKKILILVSHDLEPLNTVCTDIIHMKDKTLTQYQGNYDGYFKSVTDLLNKQANLHEWEEKKKKRLQAALTYLQAKNDPKNSAQVASKQKCLDRLGQQKTATGRRWKWSNMGDRIQTPAIVEDEEIRFKLHSDKRVREMPEDEHILQASKLSFSYTPDKPVFSNVTCDLLPSSRVALIGKNGSGKSTLLSCLALQKPPTTGEITTMPGFRVGYYQQDHINKLPVDMSPVEYMSEVHPKAKIQEIRDQLGSFGITPVIGGLQCGLLSAGQRARVVLATVTFGRPSLLLLDEPTNHLDLESQKGLVEALRCFKAACIFVTHSEYLIQECCNEVWAFEPNKNSGKTFRVLTESFSEWKTTLLNSTSDPPKKEKPRKVGKDEAVDPPSSGAPSPAPKNLGGAKGVVKNNKVACRVCKGDHFTHQCSQKQERDKKRSEKEAKQREKQQQEASFRAALAAAPTTYADASGDTWNVVVPKGMKKRMK